MSAHPPPPPPEDGPPASSQGHDELDALGPALVDALDRVMGVLRRQGRKKVGQLAKKGRERLDQYQARRDLEKLYQKLGREVLCLVEAGELTHPALLDRAERIRQQEALVKEAEAQACAGDPNSRDADGDEVSEE
ncbi:MAG: hypothetical protein H6741_02740 [Alphaproteobacteria bacterium]|nr:hypothetical protein [Alphaproteobacteria bacterium]MCB9791622.1 hypothetical protein [Alphaproteobacteria bacterium]